MSKSVEDIAEELASKMDCPMDSSRTRSLGGIETDDGRLAEVQLKVETDDWEWIRTEEELEKNSLNSGGDKR